MEHIIPMLDGNSTMKQSDFQQAKVHLKFREAVLSRHGTQGPATFCRNKTQTPIDGLWVSQGLVFTRSGYLHYDSIFPGLEHRCLWMDISFSSAFGHNMPAIVSKWFGSSSKQFPDGTKMRLVPPFQTILSNSHTSVA